MSTIFEIREQYGGVFATVLEDIIIPWKPLSIGDYIKYSYDINRGVLPQAQLENEIFTKCVQDKTYIRQLPFLKSGLVSLVVENIWQYSGPIGIDEFNNDLETARGMINADGSNVLHDLVQTITLAFPYKPEEVYAMDYETLLLRTAQAEKKLMYLGMQQEPIFLRPVEQEQQPRQRKKFKNLNPQDIKKVFDEQYGPRPVKDTYSIAQENQQMSREKWWNVSPVLESEKPALNSKNLREQIAEETAPATGHDRLDGPVFKQRIAKERQELAKRAEIIYADLIKAWKEKHK